MPWLPPCPTLGFLHAPKRNTDQIQSPQLPSFLQLPVFLQLLLIFRSFTADYNGEIDGGGGAQQQNTRGSCTKVPEISAVLDSWLLFTEDSRASGFVCVPYGPSVPRLIFSSTLWGKTVVPLCSWGNQSPSPTGQVSTPIGLCSKLPSSMLPTVSLSPPPHTPPPPASGSA